MVQLSYPELTADIERVGILEHGEGGDDCKRLRANNGLKRLNKEIKRRTRVASPQRDQRRLGNRKVSPEPEIQMTRLLIPAFTEEGLPYQKACERAFGSAIDRAILRTNTRTAH